ncbi:MAG: GatB/YqeY domain-containing protein, partial [Anaerolineales bacterium]
LKEEDILKILQKEASSRQETIEEASGAGREDLVESTQVEVDILEEYLPQQLSDEEIKTMAQEVIEETGASGPGDMGQVMGPLMSRTAGRADGSEVSRIVRQLLAEE